MRAKEKVKQAHSKQVAALPTLLPKTAGYAAMGVGVASVGVTADCARSSKPPPKKMSSFFESISADVRAKQLAEKFKTDADARKKTGCVRASSRE